MKRLLVCLILILLLGQTLFVASAQDVTPTPPLPTPDVERIATEIANTADEIAAMEGRAHDSFDRAGNFLGIFEAIGLIVSVVSGFITVLAIVGGLVGFRGLASAREELEATRAKVQEDLEAAQAQFRTQMDEQLRNLDTLRHELQQQAADQRERVAKANLALSYLPVGERLYKSQDREGAVKTYLRALDLDPDNLITRYRLGYVYTQMGRLDEAQEHLTYALTLRDDFAPALAALGYVTRRKAEKMSQGLDRDKMLNEAERLILAGLSISPNLVDDDGESWWGSLAGLYRRRGQIDAAIDAYDRAAKVTPKSSYAFSNLALLFGQKQDRQRMLRSYQRVEQLAWGEIQKDADNYWAYADLVTSRLALGKVKEADEAVVEMFSIAPKGSTHEFESLRDTLKNLSNALPANQNAHIAEFIQRLETKIADIKQGLVQRDATSN
jgi:tetratricopeptide (TPR) repeat protein